MSAVTLKQSTAAPALSPEERAALGGTEKPPKALSARSLRPWLGCLFLASFLAGFWVLRSAERGSVELTIDAAISLAPDDHVEVYVNNVMSEPKVRTINDAERRTYTFTDLPGTVSNLRIDPTTRRNVTVRIFGMDFGTREGERVHVTPQQLAAWRVINGVGALHADEGYYEIRSDDDVRLEGEPGVSLHTGLISWAPLTLVSKGVFWLLAIIAAVFTVLRFGARASFLPLAVLAACLFVARAMLLYVISGPGEIPAVDQAIGYANFAGVAKQSEFRAFWAMLGSALAVCLVAVAVRSCLAGVRPPDDFGPARSSSHPWFTAGCFLLLAAALVPDVPGIFRQAETISHASAFDAQNFYTWQYFFFRGLVPMKDFWYPYSGFYYLGFGAPYPRRWS